MKAIVFLILLMLPIALWADMGSSAVYKAKYILKNGESITGYLTLSGYDDYAYVDANNSNKYCGDKVFQILINHYFYDLQRKLSFTIYRQIEIVQFDNTFDINNLVVPTAIGYTDSSSVVSLNLDDVKYTVFLSVRQAPWGSSSINVVSNMNVKYLNTHKVHQLISIEYPNGSTDFEYGGIAFILSFNQRETRESLKKIEKEFTKELFPTKLTDEIKVKTIIESYLNRGYFFVEWGGGC